MIARKITMKNYKGPSDTVEVTAPADVKSGDGVLVGKLFGVAEFSAAAGARVNISRSGIFTLPKTSAQAWTEGAVLYWDGTRLTTADNSGANTKVGYAAAVAANPSPTGSLILHQ
jgi:predicted RecA/RadA family phage recombinase